MVRKRINSCTVYENSCQLMPGGVNSPVRSFPGLSLTPIVAQKGKGAIVWDVDHHSYIDYCCSWGALILGHSYSKIIEQVTKQLHLGSSFGMSTELEYQLAHKICFHMPSIEKIRFVSSGTEATMSAIRLARGYTQKDIIIKFDGNYHGHSDGLLVQAGSGVTDLTPQSSSKGVPLHYLNSTLSLPFNDIKTCLSTFKSRNDIAAVILEPIAANMGLVPARKDFLFMLREETEKRGIVLIFDEVITGFRVGLQGAQGYYGIYPDLTCLGKIIGGGFPAGAFGGKQSIMDLLAPLGDVYQAGTLSGNPIAMQAGLTQITELEKKDYNELQDKTILIVKALEEMMKRNGVKGCIQQLGSIFTPFFGPTIVTQKTSLDINLYNQFFYYLFQQGIYFAPSAYEANFVSFAHTKGDIDMTCEIINKF